MHRLVPLLFIVFLISGCASQTLPPFTKEQTLLVIPKQNTKTSLKTWSRTHYLILKSVDDEEAFEPVKIWLNNNPATYVALHSIPPGSYEISAVKWITNARWRSPRSVDEGYQISVPVEVVAGQISMPSYRFVIEQKSEGSRDYTNIDYERLDCASLEQIKQDISELEHGSTWGETTKAIKPINPHHCVKCDLSKAGEQAFEKSMKEIFDKILSHHNAPPQDGNRYQGTVRLNIGIHGNFESIDLTKPSGHDDLDQSFLDAISRSGKIQLPDDKCAVELLTTVPFVLSYDETDMKEPGL